MDALLTYQGRPITPADLAFLRALIAAPPRRSRRALSFAVCAAWQWTQPNGTPCDAVCRGLLLRPHRAGHLVLPPARWVTGKPWRPRTSATPVRVALHECQSCGHLMPTPAGQAKVERCVERGIEFFLGRLH